MMLELKDTFGLGLEKAKKKREGMT